MLVFILKVSILKMKGIEPLRSVVGECFFRDLRVTLFTRLDHTSIRSSFFMIGRILVILIFKLIFDVLVLVTFLGHLLLQCSGIGFASLIRL